MKSSDHNPLQLYLLLLLCSLFACQSPNYNEVEASSKAAITTDSLPTKKTLPPMYKDLQNFQTIEIAGHSVDIALPDSGITYSGNIVVLPGYNYARTHWCEQAHAPQLCSLAKAKGFVLIMPEMARSVYSSAFFPETRADLKQNPMRQWLTDSVFSYLQTNHNLLLPNQNNYLLGLSTGGRGVALVALDKPELFAACAALSGDFDQTKMPTDKLMANYYGAYGKFKTRWESVDNVLYRIKDWKTPIYLGHGQMDKVVPPEQTRLFYDSLIVHFDSSKVQLNEPKGHAHDYKYWGSETESIFAFFALYKQE